MRIILIIFYLILILVGVSFAVLNAAPVSVNFYFTMIKMPISVLMTITLGIGVLIGAFLFLCKYWRLKIEHHKIKVQLKLTEKEIKNLRSIPLQDQH
ncbi:LapA family protein [Legionella nagasakiensis]|uniref:LapA family protein n=1 Tax=Legionella nagasakiensis TaxID=535290 RepID=UPI0010547041|nr:LapA family protein [Legionella nagasakiensis]